MAPKWITLEVIWLLVVDFLVHFECLLVRSHSSVAGSNHQPPLNLPWLNLRSPFEEVAGSLVELLLDKVDAKPGYGFYICRQVAVGLLVVV